MAAGEDRRLMTEEGAGEPFGLLAEQRLGRTGLEVKLDKGFAEGTYAVYVEFDDLAVKVGFAAAHRTARTYCDRLKDQLNRLPGYSLGEIEDASRTGDPHRQRDLESTFLSFTIDTADGRFHDSTIHDHFRLAMLRAGQAWDQDQARVQAHRRNGRQEKFRQELSQLLEGEGYGQLDAGVKERLLSEIPALAFPVRGIGR